MAELHRRESSKSASREATASGVNDEAESDDGTHNAPASDSQMSTSTSARKRFGLGTFGRLPPELRNSVYECMFDGEVEASSLYMSAGPTRLLYGGSKEGLRRALIPLQVCLRSDAGRGNADIVQGTTDQAHSQAAGRSVAKRNTHRTTNCRRTQGMDGTHLQDSDSPPVPDDEVRIQIRLSIATAGD